MWSNAAANAGSSHECGEHFVCRVLFLVFGGSSPRMRGAPYPHFPVRPSCGIIPADAGSTSIDWWLWCPCQDHPRGCGEHHKLIQITARVHGSSPRMRGALPLGPWHCGPEGIIPADAGSTVSAGPNTASRKDHPRGCGEHFGNRYDRDIVKGSSPRMRGAQVAVKILVHDGGIIPADAGSTDSLATFRPDHKDHPRGCGEHYITLLLHYCCSGSSPRMRGARMHSLVLADSRGIIPADAGSTENLAGEIPAF